ncbi:restriction endonuclease subunit S [Pediococcus ethanolidurans]|uniref:restriction endonuclease subunit S n=1 Tax=Pediococcus ethanolidurans TaxID=319653 RepID=UPI0029549F3C|nr:restriction endonuclease subunit S [Pediococcus ethanolidurans]MDV7719655.1 restriction endonuclease subunit S [Pediococcus ethanolidurans]
MSEKIQPKVRFSGFTDAWEQRKLGEVTENFDEKRIPVDSTLRENGNYPYYGATGIIDYVNHYLFDGEYILLAEDGENIIARTSPVAYLTHGRFWLNNHAHIMRMIKGSNIFLVNLLENINYIKYNSGTAQPKLNAKAVKNIEVSIPDNFEQSYIGQILETINTLIAANQSKLEELKTVKKLAMQKIFDQEWRFKGFTDPWEQRKLEDIKDPHDRYAFTGGPFGSDLKSENYEKKGVRIIQLQNIGDGQFLNRYKIYTSEKKAKELHSDLIYPGEIIIAKMADPLARAAIVPKFDAKYLMASDGIRLKVDKDKYDTYFILTSINSKNFRNMALSNSTGTTRKRIGLQTLENLTLSVPSKKEQIRIDSLIKSLDDLIAANQQKCDQLKKVKKWCMQNLFV